VDTLGFNVRVKTGFALDLGNNPPVGDAWSPDAWLDLGGFRLHVRSVQVRRRDVGAGDWLMRYVLDFELDAPRTPRGYLPNAPFLHIEGAQGQQSEVPNQSSGPLRAGVYFETLPKGRVQVNIEEATVVIPGPWSIRWTPSGSGQR